MVTYLWIALGSALGGVGRYACSEWAGEAFGLGFPWGTLIVNVAGSFVIGFFAALTGPAGRLTAPSDARAFVMVGICGGYTTFSSFSFQTLALMQNGAWGRAGLNVTGSVALCLAAVWLGHLAATALNPARS